MSRIITAGSLGNSKKFLTFLVVILTISVIVSGCSRSSRQTAKIADKKSKDSGQSGGQNGNRGDAEFGLTEKEIVKRVNAVEELIAKYMNSAGFEYVPVDYATVRAAMDSNSKSSTSKTNPDKFRKEFGYGITTLYKSPKVQANMGEGKQNIRIREGLSVADRVAYDRALYGENPNATFVVSLDDEDFSKTGGFTRAAVEKVFSAKELGPGFVNYQNGESVRIDQDPRVIAAIKKWAGGMRKAGYNYKNPDEIDADLAKRLDAITGGADPKTLSVDAKAALKQLQGEEIAIATADHKYELKYVDKIKKKVETEIFGVRPN